MLGKATKGPEQRSGSNRPEATDQLVSVISKDMKIVGHCSTKGRLRIHGTVSGNVTARGVELGSTGSVEGDVLAAPGTEGHYRFVIDGSVTGAVRAGQVEVGRNGTVQRGVEADEAVVHGKVTGGVVARDRLSLGSTAAVEGDVTAKRLGLEEGGRVNGRITMPNGAAPALKLDEKRSA